MRTPFGPAIVLLFIAGCLGPGDGAPELPGDPDIGVALPVFSAPVAVATITDMQGEFFLAPVGNGSTVLACTHGGFVAPAPKYVSRDAGATWTPLQPTPPTGVSGDCIVTIGDDGTWYFVDSQVAGNTVSSTTDEGSTWTVNRLTTPPVTGTADRPYLVPLGASSMGLTYVGQYLAPGTVAFTRTDDHGATWTTPITVSQIDDGKTNIMHGRLVTDAERSAIRVPLFRFGAQDYPSGGPAQGDLGFATSRDGGASWAYEAVVDPVEALFVPPAVAWSQDVIYWAYQVPADGKQDLMLVSSLDAGATWSQPHRLAGGWDYLGYMWMSAGPDGTAVLSFDADAAPLGGDQTGEHVILMRLDARLADPLVWAAAVAPAANAEFSTAEHDAAGRLHVTYRLGDQWLYQREI